MDNTSFSSVYKKKLLDAFKIKFQNVRIRDLCGFKICNSTVYLCIYMHASVQQIVYQSS